MKGMKEIVKVNMKQSGYDGLSHRNENMLDNKKQVSEIEKVHETGHGC